MKGTEKENLQKRGEQTKRKSAPRRGTEKENLQAQEGDRKEICH
jgi:hypothetical protein